MIDEDIMIRQLDSLEAFSEALIKVLERMAAERDYAIKQSIAQKVNQQDKPSINIGPNGSNILVSVYPKDLYEHNKDTYKTVGEVAKEAMELAEAGQRQVPCMDIDSVNAESAKEHLYLQVINGAQNQKIAESCAHIKINDLIAIPRWSIDIGEESHSASFIVSHRIQAEQLHMTDAELLNIAKANTEREYELRGMSEVLRELIGDDISPSIVDDMLPDGPETMYVLNAMDKEFGASAIVSTDTLKDVYDKLGGSYYILPSSRFEVLCVPASGVANPAELKEMVEQVNKEEVKPEDRLSDNVYRFDGIKLQICNSLQDLRKQQETKVSAQNTVNCRVKM